MIETICRVCGARYQPSTDHVCSKKRPAKKSTAARKDVPGSLRMTPASDPQPEPQDRIGGLGNDPEVVILAAGTQAPPVDTLRKAEAAAAHLAPKRGRPKIHPDRKLYKAQKERERRARKGKPNAP